MLVLGEPSLKAKQFFDLIEERLNTGQRIMHNLLPKAIR